MHSYRNPHCSGSLDQFGTDPEEQCGTVHDPKDFATKLGEETFVAYVTEPGVQQMQIMLPFGEWIDYWDASQSYTGLITQPVPLGKEPIFIRNRAIIPMQVSRGYTGHGTRLSEGSLSVLVYPNGKSRFRYRDDA